MTGPPDAAANAAINAAFVGVEARLVRVVNVTCAAAPVAAGVWLGWRTGMGVGLGAGLNLVSFHWMRAGVGVLFHAATHRDGDSAPPRLGKLRFGSRLALLGACVYAIFMSHLVPFPPVLWGLLAVPAGVFCAVLAEAFRSLWNSSGSPTC